MDLIHADLLDDPSVLAYIHGRRCGAALRVRRLVPPDRCDLPARGILVFAILSYYRWFARIMTPSASPMTVLHGNRVKRGGFSLLL